MKTGSLFLIGGGLAAVGAGVYVAVKKSNNTVDAIEKAIAGTAPPADPSAPAQAGRGGFFEAHLTSYWPFQAGLSDAERKMEGGTKDRKGKPLITVDQHLADPTKYPYFSVAGDDAIFPYGQKVLIPWLNGKVVVGRVVDTGGNFRGLKKAYRVFGREPLDICVQSSKTPIPKDVTAQIIANDSFEVGKAVATGAMRGQTVAGEAFAPMVSATAQQNAGVVPNPLAVPYIDQHAPDALPNEFDYIPAWDAYTGAVLEGRTVDDYEALARAVESELSGRPRAEQIVAGWAMRNRADNEGKSVFDMLAPNGEFGPASKSGGFASTRKPASNRAREVATAVLGAAVHDDPTAGATDFWVPSQQEKFRQLGDVHRAALRNGDLAKAAKYAKYAGYCSEGAARARHAKQGLRPTDVVGCVELLAKRD